MGWTTDLHFICRPFTKVKAEELNVTHANIGSNEILINKDDHNILFSGSLGFFPPQPHTPFMELWFMRFRPKPVAD